MIRIISFFLSVWSYLLRFFFLQSTGSERKGNDWACRSLTVLFHSLHGHWRASYCCYFQIFSALTRVNIQIVPLDPSFLLCRDQQGALRGCAQEKNSFSIFLPSSLLDLGIKPSRCWEAPTYCQHISARPLAQMWLSILSQVTPGQCLTPLRTLREANDGLEGDSEMGSSLVVRC